MSEPLLIQSRNNPRIKSTVALKESRKRRATGLFLLEGLHEVETAFSYGHLIKEIYAEPDRFDCSLEGILSNSLETKLFHINKSVSEKISIRQNPAGIVAVCEQRKVESIDALESADEPILVLESIEKPGNLGAILRSSKAFNFRRIVLNNTSIDPYHPNVIRNSRGHSLGFAIYSDSRENTVRWCEENNYSTYVASPESDADVSNIQFPNKTAIILGNEHDGVSDYWKNKATNKLKISMNESVDSLNVSVSASIVLYEVFKQLRK